MVAGKQNNKMGQPGQRNPGIPEESEHSEIDNNNKTELTRNEVENCKSNFTFYDRKK